MIWLAVVALVVLLVLAVWVMRGDSPSEEIDPEEATRAAIELHAIRRRLDVAWLQSEQRRESTRVRREIEEALK